MPFVKSEDYNEFRSSSIGQPPTVKEPEAASLPEVFGAALKDNPINSAVSGLGNGLYKVGNGEVDPDYDPFDDIANTQYEQFNDRFIQVNNRAEAELVKNSIDEELEADRVVQQAGAMGFVAAVASEVVNPVNYIPVGLGVNTVMKGGSILKGAATAAAAGAGIETINEAALQASQETRTLEQSAINIGAATALTGILGGGASLLVRRAQNKDKLAQDFEKDMTVPADKEQDSDEVLADAMTKDSAVDGFDDSVGAARVYNTTLDQESLVNSYGVAKATAFLNPLLRLAHSPSKTARQLSQELVENPVYFNKNKEGVPTPQAVETLRKQYEGGLASGLRTQKDQYKAYKKAMKGQGVKVANYMEFQEEVAKAMRRGDTSDNPFAQSVARSFRKEVFDPLKQVAVSLKMLPEDVSVATAESYLMRIWDKQRIIQHEDEFRGIVNQWVRENAEKSVRAFQRETNSKIAGLERKLAKAEKAAEKAKIQRQIDDVRVERDVEERITFDAENNFDSYVDDVTDSITRQLLGWDGVSPTYALKVAERGPLKDRTFNIPDERVESFLSNNMERIAGRYTRVMGTDVELQRKFGSLTFEQQSKDLDDSYRELAETATTPKERKQLAKQRDQDKKDLESMLGIMRGTGDYTADPSNKWVRAGRQLRILQYLSKMGGVVVSSFADVGRPVMVHGMSRVFGKALPKLITQGKGYKAAIKEAKKAGQVTEGVLNGRIATLAEIGDPYAEGTAFERFTQNLADTFSKVNLSSQWNDLWKGVSSVLTQDRVLENVLAIDAGKKLSPTETQYMAFLGIDKDSAKAMAKQYKKHGQKEDGIRIANTDQWDDLGSGLARTFRGALNKDVDRTIVTKGIADVPLFVNSETGKLLTQFRTFAMASHQRVLIAGLQQGDAAFVNGLIFSVTAGMAVYAMKETARGKELSDDPNKWIVEGIDLSGVFSVMMEANNTLEKMGAPGLSAVAGAPPTSRYASRNMLGSFIGPTAGTVQDIGQSTRAVLQNDLKKTDVRAMRRLLPYQNLFYTRKMLDEAEEAIAQSLGAK